MTADLSYNFDITSQTFYKEVWKPKQKTLVKFWNFQIRIMMSMGCKSEDFVQFPVNQGILQTF